MACNYIYEGITYTEEGFKKYVADNLVQKRRVPKYEKILFPTGNTASLIEGHQTLEDFKKQKEDRLDQITIELERNEDLGELEKLANYYMDSDQIPDYPKSEKDWEHIKEMGNSKLLREQKQLKEELKRVETEGLAALKPIYDFYENRVKNTLNKIYGKDKVERIKDEYGNEWYQVDIDRERELSPIFFQLSPNEAVDRIIKGFKSLRPKFFERKFVGYSTGTTASKMATEINRWIKDKEAFSGIKAISIGAYNTIAFQDINTGKLYQLSSESTEAADEGLDAIMKGYISSLGGKVNQGKEIVVDGKKVSANAVTNVVARTVDYVQDKAKIDTLPEETAHIWFHWLPLNSVLRRDMMKDIRTRPIYDQVMEEYSGNSYYQNSDGTVNEEKIAIEAIGKLIAGAIVGEYKKDKKVQSLLQRLIDFIKGLFKGFDGYREAAQQILQGDTSFVEKEISLAQEANQKGEYYFQLSEDEEKMAKVQMRNATPVQKKIIQEVYLDVHNRVVLDPVTHTYTNLNIENPVTYTSVTTAIHGKKDFGVDEHGVPMYEANRLWGNDFDGIMSDVIQGKKVIRDTPNISPEVRGEVIGYIRAMIDKFTADGSIALTQVIVTDEQAHIAGSIDLLLIDPLGNMRIVDLKTSWSTTKDKAFRNTKYNTGEGSLIKEPISKRTGYSVQVGSYAKMINLMGYPVAETRSEHILLQHADDKVTGFTYEGAQIYLSSENEKLVDAIVPTIYEGKDRLAELNNEFSTGNPTHKEDFDSNAPESEAKRMEYAEAQAMLAAATLKGWKEYMKDLKHETAFSISNSSIMRIDALLNAMQKELDEGRGYSGVYTVFLHKLNDHLTSILHYLNSPENVKSPAYIRTALLAKEYISRFKDLAYVEKFGDAFQIGLSNRVLQNIRNVDVAIVQAIENHVKELVATWTTNPAYKDSKVLEEAVTGIQKDITNATLYLDTIGNSGNVILENLSKLLATKREEIRDMVEQNDSTIDTAANNLAEAMGTHDSKKMYDIFHQKDSKGKRTGQLIGQKGQYYKELAAKVNGDLEFYDEGTHSWRRKEYIKNAVSKEDIQWNKDLYYLKERQRLFNSAEKTAGDYNTGSVNSEDGDYHMLSDSFKAERSQYMYQDSTKSGMWVAKNENDPVYQEWRDRNMTWVEWTGAITKWNKKTKVFEPTGQTEDRSGWFPNKEHVTSREISSKETGSKDLWDKDFRKIMTGTSPVEKAQRAYYIAYKDMMRKLVEGLPAGAMQWFDQGYIPTIRANFVQQLADKDINTAELITSELKNFFEMTATYDDSSVAKTGVTQSLPIMYMGTLQSQKRMKEVQDMLAHHSAKKLTATNQKEWLKEHRALAELLKKESARVTAEQLHPDLTIGLKAMNQMATNFYIMSGVEDSLQAVKSHLLEQKFNDKGKLIDGGASTRTLQLLNHVMDVCFYNDPAFTKTTMERMTGKLMQLTSTLSIPLNLFGMVNNKLMARLNNRIDSIGGDFFSKKAYRRAQIRYNTEHVPGYVRTRMQFMNDKGYGEKRPGSKYEALTHKFNMVRHLKTNDGRVDFIAKIGGYAGYEAGEWEVQSLVGNSIIDTVQMKYTGTDPNLQDCSVYDAHSFDSNTGKLELIPGYVYTDKEGNVVDDQKKAQYLIVNRIHETNDRIHGNYDPANKVFLERTAAGKMILQFHKWVWPAFKQRYKSKKWDENLGGGMDIEGRYTTLWEFLKAFKELGDITDRWAELSDHQRSNLKKDLADAMYIAGLLILYHLVKKMGEGLGDDDPYVKKMKNWMLYQSHRGLQEVSIFVPAIGAYESIQLVQNPFACTSSIRNFALLVHDMTLWPIRTEEQRIYQRGNYKGTSKIEVDALRLLPGGGSVRTWINLETIESFYISGK